MSPYSCRALANTLLRMGEAQGVTDMSPMKLQKLVYYAHAWHLAFHGKPLIREEIQAWKYGPVIQELYHEFKEFGNDPIERPAHELDYASETLTLISPEIPADDTLTHELLKEVFRIYGHLTPIQLSNQSHSTQEPWSVVAEKFKDELPRWLPIPNALIEQCFKPQMVAAH